MLDTLKLWYTNIDSAFTYVNSAWMFVRLMPVCLVVESTIIYIYFKRIKEYGSAQEKSRGLRNFWKIMAIKIAIAIGLFCYALGYVDESYSPILLYRVVFYYLYALVVVELYVRHLVKNRVWFPEEKPIAPQGSGSSSRQNDG